MVVAADENKDSNSEQYEPCSSSTSTHLTKDDAPPPNKPSLRYLNSDGIGKNMLLSALPPPLP